MWPLHYERERGARLISRSRFVNLASLVAEGERSPVVEAL